MDKLAQKKKRRMGFFNELNEDYGPGKLVEKFHEKFTGEEGQFAELMNTLREVDGEAREIAAPLKNTIKAARSSFNRREYVACVSYLGQYHDALESIMIQFGKLNGAVDLKHHEFLFNGVDDEAMEYFKTKLPDKFKPKTKTAGISDWWSNLTSSKGRALKAWEQRFPKFAKKFKAETEKLLTRAEGLQYSLALSLKGMAGLRASRRLEEYLDVVRSLTGKYKEFDQVFNKYYTDYAQKLIEDQKEFSPKEENAELGIKGPDGEAPSESKESKESKEEALIDSLKEDMEPKLNNNKPADFPESIDLGDPSELSPRVQRRQETLEDLTDSGIFPTQNVYTKNVHTQPIQTNRIPSEPFDLVQRKAPVPEKDMVLSRPTMRSPVNERYVSDTLPPSAPARTYPEPGRGLDPEPFPATPSARREPYSPSPSALARPVSNTIPVPSNSVRHTQPFGTDSGPSSVPIPPVRPASFPAAPDTMPEVTIPSPGLLPGSRASVDAFLTNLTKLSNQSPIVLANEIIKFAATLPDKSTSDQLLQIAKSILK